jgi:hypothetical protein
MADWTSIPDATFDPDRPVLGSTHLAIVKNFEALAEGASGAPRVQTLAVQDGAVTDAKLNTSATNTGRDWVLARSALSAVGAVGTYAFLGSTSNASISWGATYSGSALRAAGVLINRSWSNTDFNSTVVSQSNFQNITPAGTWRCMGTSRGGNDSTPNARYPATLFLRIS